MAAILQHNNIEIIDSKDTQIIPNTPNYNQIKENTQECFNVEFTSNVGDNVIFMKHNDNVIASFIYRNETFISLNGVVYENVMFIYSVCTAKKYRKKNYMSELLTHFKQKYNTKIYLDVSFNNKFTIFKKLIKFYNKHGFFPVQNMIKMKDEYKRTFCIRKYSDTEYRIVLVCNDDDNKTLDLHKLYKYYINGYRGANILEDWENKTINDLSEVDVVYKNCLYYSDDFILKINQNYFQVRNKKGEVIGIIIYEFDSLKYTILHNTTVRKYDDYSVEYTLLNLFLTEVVKDKPVFVKVSYDINKSLYDEIVSLYKYYNFDVSPNMNDNENYLYLYKSATQNKTIQSRANMMYELYYQNKYGVIFNEDIQYEDLNNYINIINMNSNIINGLSKDICINIIYKCIIDKIDNIHIEKIIRNLQQYMKLKMFKLICEEFIELCIISDNKYCFDIVYKIRYGIIHPFDDIKTKYKCEGFDEKNCDDQQYLNKIYKCKFDDVKQVCNRIPMTINHPSNNMYVHGIELICKFKYLNMDIYLIGETHRYLDRAQLEPLNTITITDLIHSTHQYWSYNNKIIDTFIEAKMCNFECSRIVDINKFYKKSPMFDLVNQYSNILCELDNPPNYKFNDIFKYKKSNKIHYIDTRTSQHDEYNLHLYCLYMEQHCNQSFDFKSECDKYITKEFMREPLAKFLELQKTQNIDDYVKYIFKSIFYDLKYFKENNLHKTLKFPIIDGTLIDALTVYINLLLNKLLNVFKNANVLYNQQDSSIILFAIYFFIFAIKMDVYTICRLFKVDINNKLLHNNVIIYTGYAHTYGVCSFFYFLKQYKIDIKLLACSKSNIDGYTNIADFVQPFFVEDSSTELLDFPFDYMKDYEHTITYQLRIFAII